MMEKNFTINDVEDIFKAIGKIIQSAQEWERDYKELAKILNIELDDEHINTASLNKLNEKFKGESKLSQKDYENLKGVIDMRNYINHEFFLKDFDKPFVEIEEILNKVQFYIFEANDVESNQIDHFRGSQIRRPTVFD